MSLSGPRRRRSRFRPSWALSVAGVLAISSVSVGASAEPSKDQCIDANESAQGLRKSEKLRDAEQKLLLCASAGCPGPVRDDCAQRLTELRAAMPTLVFVVKDDADQDLRAVRVTIDGETLTDKLDGTAIAIDPGAHRFTFEAAGRGAAEKSLVVREGEKERHEKVVLVAASAPPTVAVPVEVSPTVPIATDVPAASTPTPIVADGKAQRNAGLVIGGIGVAGILVGSVFGIVSKVEYAGALKDECKNDDPTRCTSGGVADGRTAHAEADVATVAFTSSAVLLGVGAVLYFTAPRSGIVVGPTAGPGSAGLSLHAGW